MHVFKRFVGHPKNVFDLSAGWEQIPNTFRSGVFRYKMNFLFFFFKTEQLISNNFKSIKNDLDNLYMYTCTAHDEHL